MNLPFTSANLTKAAGATRSIVTAQLDGVGVATNGEIYDLTISVTENSATAQIFGMVQGTTGRTFDANTGDWFGASSNMTINFSYIAA